MFFLHYITPRARTHAPIIHHRLNYYSQKTREEEDERTDTTGPSRRTLNSEPYPQKTLNPSGVGGFLFGVCLRGGDVAKEADDERERRKETFLVFGVFSVPEERKRRDEELSKFFSLKKKPHFIHSSTLLLSRGAARKRVLQAQKSDPRRHVRRRERGRGGGQ